MTEEELEELENLRVSAVKSYFCVYPYCTSMSKSWTPGLCRNHQMRQYSLNFDILEYGVRSLGVCELEGCEQVGSLQLDHDNTCCRGTPRCGSCNRGFLCLIHNRLVSQHENIPERPVGPISDSVYAYLDKYPWGSSSPVIPIEKYGTGKIRQGARWVEKKVIRKTRTGRKPWDWDYEPESDKEFWDKLFAPYLHRETEEESAPMVFHPENDQED